MENISRIDILKKIEFFIKEKVKIMEESRKKDIIRYINKPLSDLEVKHYNNKLKAKSKGWLDKFWTENDIKMEVLKDNRHLFTNDEYLDYFQQIFDEPEIKIKH